MCDPVTALVVGTVINVAGQVSAAEDAEDAYHAQAASTYANAQHRKLVAEYNAGIFTEQAGRLRNEMVDRLNEVAGVNISRIKEEQVTNVGRIEEALGINVGRFTFVSDVGKERLTEDFERLASELNMDAEKDIDRITEVSQESVSRLGRRAKDVSTTGFEIESDLRQEIAQDVSAQRSFYAAGNVVVTSGTPMRLQTDSYQQGEVQAQRIRRDYRIKVQDLEDTASDVMRDALFQVEDIETETLRRTGKAARETGREVEDINTTLAWNLGDLQRTAGYQIEDIDTNTDIRLTDIERTQGYDLSDTEFEALKLDQQATLTLIQGDAELAAGVNRAAALEQAGEDVFAGGITTAVGSGLTGVASAWYTSQSTANQAPVTTSVPDFP